MPEGAAPNPSAAGAPQASNKGAPAIVISNGPLCKPLIAASLRSGLSALLPRSRCTLSGSRAVKVLLLLFISPSQQALSCSIHHGKPP